MQTSNIRRIIVKQMVRKGKQTLKGKFLVNKIAQSRYFLTLWQKLCNLLTHQFDWANFDHDGGSVSGFSKTAHSSPLNILNLSSTCFFITFSMECLD